MTDLNLSIKLTTEGGQVVVREITSVQQAADSAAAGLKEAGSAGESAGKQLAGAGDGASGLNGHMTVLARTAGLLVGALGAVSVGGMFAAALEEQQTLQRNMQRTESVIRSMGNAAGLSVRELHGHAAQIAASTQYSEDAVMRAQQVLLTYSTISGDMFRDSVELATDLAALMGGSLQGSIEQLGRALDDPIKGIQALADSGYRFADSQKRLWADLVNTGRLTEAQAQIIAELRTQVGGLARNELTELDSSQREYEASLSSTKVALAEYLDLSGAMSGLYSGMTTALNSFTAALQAGELDKHIAALKFTAGALTLVYGVAYTSAAAVYLWTNRMALATAASRAFSAQSAMTAASFLSVRTAALMAAAAFAGWEIGTWLRNEFEVVEQAGIGMAAGVHKSIVWLGGQFDVFGARIEQAMTDPLGVVKDAFIDWFQWLSGMLDAPLEFAGIENPFAGLKAQLEEFRSESGRAIVEPVKEQLAQALAGIDEEYAALFASVGKSAESAGEKIKEVNKNIGNTGVDTSGVDDYNKALLSLYNTQKLNAEAVDQYGRALTGIDLELFKANFREATQLPVEATAAIREYAIAAEAAKNVLAADEYLQAIRDENALLQVRLQYGEEEYAIQKAIFQLKGGDPAVLAQIEGELRAQQKLNDQIALSEKHANGAFQAMLNGMTALTDAGGNMGDVLVQTFGRVAQQINAMSKSQAGYTEQLEKLQAERKQIIALEKDDEKRAGKLLAIQQTENRLQRENFQNQMGQYAALSGTMSQFFGEQSREREALHKMEMAFSAVEMAMAIQKAAQNALVAITSQGEGDPYTAFARIAAMAALMAGLGVFSGSASGSAPTAAQRQEVQGTGTVLGDSAAKSNSIANVFDRIEELELDQYNELRAINTSIKALNAGIAKLAINLVSSYGRFDESAYSGPLGRVSHTSTGGFFGNLEAGKEKLGDGLTGIVGGWVDSIVSGFSTTKRKLKDSGIHFDAQTIGDILATGIVDASYYSVIETTKSKAWGLSKKKKTSTEYADLDNALLEEFGRVFGHISTSVIGAVDVLGLDLNRQLEDYVIRLPELSFKDLSGDEIEKELSAVFSQQSDLMVQWLVPAMSQYQQMGEGLYETLIRVAQEQAIVNAQLDALGLQLTSLGDVSAETRIAVSQSLVELMGGVENFRELTSEYFDNFYTDAEKFANLSGNVSTVFADLGLAVPDSVSGMREIVDAIDLTTDSGQQLFATLMQLVPSLREYYDVLEQRAEFEKGLKRELESLDMTGFEQSLLQLQDWYNEQIRTAESLGAETVFIERLYARKRAEAVDSELARINDEHARSLETLNNQYNQLYSAIDNASRGVADAILNIKRQASSWNEVSYQQGQITNLKGQIGVGSTSDQITAIQQMQQAITARYNAEMARNKQLADAAQQRYQTELAAVNAIRQAAQQLLTAADAMLLSNMSPELLGSQLTEAKSQFDKLTAAARKGDASAMQQLQGVGSSYLDIAKEFYAQGSDEYSAIFDEIQNIYRSLGASAPSEPRAPASVVSYQNNDARLQQLALRELEELQKTLTALQEKEKEEQALAQAALEAEHRQARDDALAAQNRHIEVAQQVGDNLAGAMAVQTKATDAVIAELRQQSNAAKADTETLRAELARTRTELARMQDLILGSRRVV